MFLFILTHYKYCGFQNKLLDLINIAIAMHFLAIAPTTSITYTSGFATTHVVVSKTSYHLYISQPPTNLPNALKIHTGENKIDR